MLDTTMTLGAGVLSAVFLTLFIVALVRKDEVKQVSTMRWATGSAAIAGLLMIASSFIGSTDVMRASSGFLLLVLATGIQVAPRRG